ncbi:MAG: tRNA uridine-5-carboxymethylaminomethyl(34) synthesis enzyme MnmG, partial [Angelakisella sp.]
IGYRLGLIAQARYDKFLGEQEQKREEIARLGKTSIAPTAELDAFLEGLGTAPLTQAVRADDLLRRPQISYAMLAPFDTHRPKLSHHVAEIEIKYAGYIEKQLAQVEQMKRLENMSLEKIGDYHQIKGLRLEAVEKLSRILPRSIGQASGISGVSPADISVLIITLEQRRQEGRQHDFKE